jgi:hypothetical protein
VKIASDKTKRKTFNSLIFESSAREFSNFLLCGVVKNKPAAAFLPLTKTNLTFCLEAHAAIQRSGVVQKTG